MLFTKKNSDQETLKIPFVAISFKSNLRMTGLLTRIHLRSTPHLYMLQQKRTLIVAVSRTLG